MCTRQRPTLLKRCLESLMLLEHPSYEVLVVDNTTGDPATEKLARCSGARYIVEPQPGLSRARNAGARGTSGGIVAFLDDDSVADRTWLSHHAAALQDQTLIATTGRVLPPSAGVPVTELDPAFGGYDLGKLPFRIDRAAPDWFERSSFGGVGVGGNMAFRRLVFERGWAFRESLGLGAALPAGEEHYAFFTLLRAGQAIAYVPEAIVRHEHPATAAELRVWERRTLERSAAYVLLLLVEEPAYRRRILRYALEAAAGRRRHWRPASPSEGLASRRRTIEAALRGAALYVRGRLV